jgi:hypothetical protein
MCICDGLGCRPAIQGPDGGTTTTTTTGTGGMGTGGMGTGGAPACNPSQAACPCVNGTCPSGLSCVNDLCIVGCNFTYQCGAGNVCANGACVPGCDSTHPCATGYACTNGACTVNQANPQCSSSNPCPSGQICSNGICTTGCTSNSQCATDEICDGATNTCIPDPSPKPVCSSAEPCPNNEVCLSDGFCHYPCTNDGACALIDNRFTCSNANNTPCATGETDCYCKTKQEISPQCTLTMPCPAGKTCISNTCF